MSINLTTAAYALPELWSPILQAGIYEKTVMRSLCDDLTPLWAAQGGGVSLRVPSIVAATARTKSAGTPATLDSPTFNKVDLDCTIHSYYGSTIENSATVAAGKISLENAIKGLASGAIAEAFDKYLTALISGSSQSVAATTDTGDDLLAHLDEAKGYLGSAFAPYEDRFVVVHPDVAGRFANLDMLANRNYNPDATVGGLGVIGRGYGFTFVESANVPKSTVSGTTTYSNLIFQRKAIGFVVAKEPSVDFAKNILNIGMDWLADMIYGAALVNDLWSVRFTMTKSA